MKLHLPKQLAAAVIAAVMAVPAAYATTLSDAVLSLDGFTAENIAAADGWTLTNVSASDSGVYKVSTQATLTHDTAWQTMVSNRSTWSGIVTFNINSLTNGSGILLEAKNGEAALSNSGGVGVAYNTTDDAKNLKGAWQGNFFNNNNPTISALADYADANGNITVGVIYDGQATGASKGTTILVGNQVANNTGLKGNDNGNSGIVLSALAGAQYSNLFLFNKAVSESDMQAMMSELSAVNTLTWNGTEASHTWNKNSANTPWTNTESASAAFTGKDEVTFDTLVGELSSTVTVDGFVNTSKMVVNDAYTLEGNGTVSAASLSGTGSLSLGDNVTLAVTAAPTLASIDGSGKVTISGLNQNATATNLHLAESWTGTVKLENLTVADTDLSAFSKNDSIVELNGVSGYLKNYANGTCSQNLKLTNLGNQNAFVINNGAQNAFFVFSGAITGNGNFATEGTATAPTRTDILFTGNLTDFEGSFIRNQALFGDGQSSFKNTGEGILQFGSGGGQGAPAVAAYASTAKAESGVIHNIAGSGDISSSSVVRFNYLADSDNNTLGVDNGSITARYLEFNRDGGTANYEVTADITGHNSTAANNTIKVSAGTTTMKGGEMSNVGNIIVAEGAQLVFGEDSTLTAGDNINIDGGIVVNGGTANFGTLTIAEGKTVSVTNTSGTVMFDGTITNNGTLNLAGNIDFNKENYTKFELKSEGSTTWSDEARAQGFEVMHGATYYAIKGGTTQGEFTLTEGITAADDGYVFTLGESVSTTYTINATTANLSSSDTDHAESYVIAADSTALTVDSGSFDYTKLATASRSHLGSLVLNGGNATIAGGNKIFSADVTINNGSTLTIGSTDAFVYSHAGLTEPEHSITVNEGGTLAFGSKRLSIGNEGGGANVYKVIINGGSITGEGEGSNGALDYFSSGTIEATGTTGEISANVRVRNGVTLTVDVKDTGDLLKMSGLINSNGSGNLVKEGKGTLEISHKNTYGGTTTVNGGTLKLATGGQDGAIKGTLNINEGGKVDLAAGDATGWGTSNHVGVLNIEGGELHVSVGNAANTNQTFANTTINMTGGSITGVEGSNIDLYSGSSTVHAKAAEGATAEAPTVSTVSGATLSLREASTTFTVDENAKLVLNTGLMNGNKNESFANALVVEGAGTLEMNAEGTYQGGTTINGGTVVAGHANALGTGAVTVNEGASLTAGEGIAMSIGTLTLNAGATIDFGTAATVTTLNIGGLVTLGDSLTTSLGDLTEGSLTLFNGVTSFTVGGEAFVAGTSIDTIFNGVDASKYVINFADSTVSITLAPSTNDIVIDPASDNQVITGGTFDNIVGETGHSVKLDGDIVISDSISMEQGSTAQITNGATVTNGGMVVTGTSTDSALTGSETADFAVSNAQVSVAEGATEDVTVTAQLVNASLVNENGTADLVVSGEGNTITSIKALEGDITLQNIGTTTPVTLTELVIKDGQVVSTYTGDVLTEENEGCIIIAQGGTATFEAGAALNSDIKFEAGSTLESNGAITMGSAVELTSGMLLDGTALTTINAATETPEFVALFTGVDKLVIDGVEYTAGQLTVGGIMADSVYSNLTLLEASNRYWVTYTTDNGGTVGINFVPEPATATLSLLALAALASRRKRK